MHDSGTRKGEKCFCKQPQLRLWSTQIESNPLHWLGALLGSNQLENELSLPQKKKSLLDLPRDV
jgi:hypothetical protein